MVCRSVARLRIQVATPELVSPGVAMLSGAPTACPDLLPLFRWEGSPGTVGYRLEIAAISGDDLNEVLETGGTTEYPLPYYLVEGATYKWRVLALHPTGDQYSASEWFHFVIQPPGLTLSTPSLVSPANAASVTTVTPILTWSAVSGASRYTIELSYLSDFSTLVQVIEDVVGTSYELAENLSPGTICYWRVQAFDANGDYSLRSSARQFYVDVLPSTPTLIYPILSVTVSRYGIVATWEPADHANGYFVKIAEDPDFEFLVLFSSGVYGTSFSVPPLQANKYYWSVQAFNDAGSSAWSTPHAFFTS